MGVTLPPGAFSKEPLSLSSGIKLVAQPPQVYSVRFSASPASTHPPQQHRAGAECEPVFSGSTVPGPTRGTGREWATGMHPEQSQIVQTACRRKKKRMGWGWRGVGWKKKKSFSCRFNFCRDIGG